MRCLRLGIQAAATGLWLPSQLFSGEAGTWLDANNFALLFTVYDGSTNVTAISDPIGRAERKAGNTHALQATSTKRPLVKQYPNGRYYVYHDRVDDVLELASIAAGIYTVATATFAGVQIYEITQNALGTLNIPGVGFTECVVIKKSLSGAEYMALNNYLSAIMPVGETDVLRLYSATNSVNLSITESGGSSGATWELGDGQTATGTSCVKTITAPQSVILRATDKSKIQQINWVGKSLFGQICNLDSLINLTIFYCYSNKLTGSIPSLDSNTALTNFYCDNNQLTGSIPSLSSNTALTNFQCHYNQLTGSIPSLSNNTALINFYCYSNQLTGSIPSLSNNTALTVFHCYSNQLTGFNGGSVSSTLGNLQAQNNLLTESAVNTLLAAFVVAGRTSASGICVLNLGGTGNAAPTGQGLTDKSTLISRGWTVTTN